MTLGSGKHQSDRNSSLFSDDEIGFETPNTNDRDLIVRSGEQELIYPRVHKYRNIIVEKGGELIVRERSRKWLVLMISGTFELAGTLSYRDFFDEEGEIQLVAPDGTELSHTFDPPQGGHGGDGGRHSSAQGGQAGSPSRLDGGGGGGGGYWATGPGYVSGGDGRGWRGSDIGKDGGSGGRQQRFLHGGLIYISVAGKFIGQGGVINVSGRVGVDGEDGEDGWNSPGAYGAAGGGGGGGAPGGNGGVVKIRASEIAGEDPVFKLDGGAGGSGGIGGEYNGHHGEDGTTGVNGWVDYL